MKIISDDVIYELIELTKTEQVRVSLALVAADRYPYRAAAFRAHLPSEWWLVPLQTYVEMQVLSRKFLRVVH
mgnify:FL=1